MVFLLTCTYVMIRGQFITIPSAASNFKPEQFIKARDGGFIGYKTTYIEDRLNTNGSRLAISVIKYDKDMNLVKEQQLPGETGFAVYHQSLQESAGKIWMICIEPLEKSKKAKLSNVVAFEIDPITLQAGNKRIIGDQNNMNQYVDGYWRDGFKLVFESSLDKKHHVLFIYNNEEEFYISGLNEKLEPTWRLNSRIPEFKMKNEYFRSFHCDNDGKGYLICSSEKDGTAMGSFNNTIASYRKILAGSETINDARFFSDAVSGNSGLIGTCMNNSENVTGVFKAVLDKKTLALEQVQITPIPVDIMERLAVRDYARLKPKNYGFIPSHFRSRLAGKDSLYLILECKDWNKSSTSVSFAVDILIVGFKNPAPLFSYIRRYAVLSRENENGHYYPFVCNDKLAIVYFDNKENINKTINDKPTNLNFDRDAMLVSAFINNDGTVQKKEVPVNVSIGLWQSVNKYLTRECEKR